MNLQDDFRSPAFKRGVKDAKLSIRPRETTQDYMKGYIDEVCEQVTKNVHSKRLRSP